VARLNTPIDDGCSQASCGSRRWLSECAFYIHQFSFMKLDNRDITHASPPYRLQYRLTEFVRVQRSWQVLDRFPSQLYNRFTSARLLHRLHFDSRRPNLAITHFVHRCQQVRTHFHSPLRNHSLINDGTTLLSNALGRLVLLRRSKCSKPSLALCIPGSVDSDPTCVGVVAPTTNMAIWQGSRRADFK
jgi:hypothetical protein